MKHLDFMALKVVTGFNRTYSVGLGSLIHDDVYIGKGTVFMEGGRIESGPSESN